jgi:hypothetical protein
MEKLMSNLAKAKAIMVKSDTIKNGNVINDNRHHQVESFDMPTAKYNIPNEMLIENQTQVVPNTKPVGVPTAEAIKNSKLPDEIKKLMLEHPISQPKNEVTLSDDLIEKANKLMNNDKPQKKVLEENRNNLVGGIDYNLIKKMIDESINSALKENGLLVENTEKSNEIFSFKVGKHMFEGKITKIKKIQ